jgi:hypothetical protein
MEKDFIFLLRELIAKKSSIKRDYTAVLVPKCEKKKKRKKEKNHNKK